MCSLQTLVLFLVILLSTCTSALKRKEPVSLNFGYAVSEDRIKSDAEVISIVRMADTDSLRQVNEYLRLQFEWGTWSVEEDVFDDDTPYGRKTFRNIIATRNPINPATQPRYVLAAHYDSKYFEAPRSFQGATDSAVPCAMILEIIRVLETHGERKEEQDADLQVIFFDGEEAFKAWTNTDSIYGSRHLAELWDAQGGLGNITLFTLLDLIGHSNPRFYSFFENTASYYSNVQRVEREILGSNVYFPGSRRSAIEDDHKPFLNRGVPVMHLISVPFPSVWHTDNDNIDNIDWTTTTAITRVLAGYFADELGLKFKGTIPDVPEHSSAPKIRSSHVF
eukprot:TRINITY_DN10653_c0_g3_i1.p1 TRINITY_DN10653_c0_g3~~TRINITY_DN10653_c0_g3_i1.p1  ORF type:complete len:336 (-),score=51.36 TRINITY_DN10653_c0_g3_i1:473-1480(-)